MGFLTFLFAIAALVWTIPIVRAGRMFLMPLAILAVGTVLGPAFFAIDGPIQLSLDRVLFFLMVALSVIAWRTGQISMPKLNRVDYLVIATVVWFYWSAISGGTSPSSSPTARWLFYIAMPAGMYAIARVMPVKPQDIRWLLIGSCGLGVYLSGTAVLEISGIHGLVFPRFIVDPEVWEFYGRGRGPLLNPSGNGIVISIALAAATIGFMSVPGRKKTVYAILMLCTLLGVYATLTRSAWMGAVAVVAVMALYHAPRWARVLAISSGLILGGLSATDLKDQFMQMKRDKNLTASDAEKSVQLRPLLAIVGWEMFQDRPIVGHGFGHYMEKNGPYCDDRSYDMPLPEARPYNQHNVFLSVLVDTGLVGFSFFGGWFAMLIFTSLQLVRNRLAAPEVRQMGWLLLGTILAYTCNGMFQDVLIIPMVHMYLFFLGGLAVTALQTRLRPSSQNESPVRQPFQVDTFPPRTSAFPG
ncbi:O-antigen ligase family protein [Stieleria varia]|uniref:O-Antigen ligase n=1 Tax=Stieleria varia TaxID=2528005 RepID=A0A5C6BA61_9BACT|nr:O-antigen ligase family protein [Stieleria varia]TWU08331.1 O-Antigen ligase [Stieleria varia]